MIWISLQDEGRMPWEREELMLSVTKERSSFANFFETKGGEGIPMGALDRILFYAG